MSKRNTTMPRSTLNIIQPQIHSDCLAVTIMTFPSEGSVIETSYRQLTSSFGRFLIIVTLSLKPKDKNGEENILQVQCLFTELNS